MIKMIREWTETEMNGRKSIWQVGDKYYFISSVQEAFDNDSPYSISETAAFECDKDENVLSWHEEWLGAYNSSHEDVAQELAA